MVDPEERTAAAAYTNTARYVVRPPKLTISVDGALLSAGDGHARQGDGEVSIKTLAGLRPVHMLLRRLDSWTRWAFNPQPELTSRYDRG